MTAGESPFAADFPAFPADSFGTGIASYPGMMQPRVNHVSLPPTLILSAALGCAGAAWLAVASGGMGTFSLIAFAVGLLSIAAWQRGNAALQPAKALARSSRIRRKQ